MAQSFFEKLYKDKNGKNTLVEIPNPPLIVWFLASVTEHFFKTGSLHSLFDLIGFGALFTWAWLELFQGHNYVRRVLGLMVLVALVQNRI